MKTTGLLNKIKNPMAVSMAVVFLLAGSSHLQAQKIGARPLTHQEIHDFALPEGTPPSGGLMTTGIGEPVYLEVLVAKGTEVSGVEWSVVPPLSATPSTATFEATPIPSDMPIYSVGAREIFDAILTTPLKR